MKVSLIKFNKHYRTVKAQYLLRVSYLNVLFDAFFDYRRFLCESMIDFFSSSLNHSGLEMEGPRISKLLRHSTKLRMGDTTDDIHVCIMCLRAIMNNKFGFNMVIQHKQAINCIALSLVRFFFH